MSASVRDRLAAADVAIEEESGHPPSCGCRVCRARPGWTATKFRKPGDERTPTALEQPLDWSADLAESDWHEDVAALARIERERAQ